MPNFYLLQTANSLPRSAEIAFSTLFHKLIHVKNALVLNIKQISGQCCMAVSEDVYTFSGIS